MNSPDLLNLPPLPARIARLPRNARGYPVPFFVQWIDGKPDFRLLDGANFARCLRERLCQICGEALGAASTFVIGPMCAVNRTNGEPPSHRECAEFAVKACPFMLRPGMERREDDTTRSANTSGVFITRNPGVMALWTTKTWKVFYDDKGFPLVNLGEPRHVSWWREGRAATFAEVFESIASGRPILLDLCDTVADRMEVEAKIARTLALARETTRTP